MLAPPRQPPFGHPDRQGAAVLHSPLTALIGEDHRVARRCQFHPVSTPQLRGGPLDSASPVELNPIDRSADDLGGQRPMTRSGHANAEGDGFGRRPASLQDQLLQRWIRRPILKARPLHRLATQGVAFQRPQHQPMSKSVLLWDEGDQQARCL